MNMNLILATGIGYGLIGGLIMFASHRAIYCRANEIVAGYPRVLAALQAQRHDGRFGLGVLIGASVLQILAVCGYSASMSQWRYPVAAGIAALLVYYTQRLLVTRRDRRPRTQPGTGVRTIRSLYETRRSRRLLDAARGEAANIHARELARGPRDGNVVYLGQQWERRWWTDRFGVSTEALTAAVRQVGPMVSDVERYFAVMRSGHYALAA